MAFPLPLRGAWKKSFKWSPFHPSFKGDDAFRWHAAVWHMLTENALDMMVVIAEVQWQTHGFTFMHIRVAWSLLYIINIVPPGDPVTEDGNRAQGTCFSFDL